MRPSSRIQLLKDHLNETYAGPAAIGCDEWEASLPLWKSFYYGHSKYRSELGEYFRMYQYQLNFAVFCVTCVLFILWNHLNSSIDIEGIRTVLFYKFFFMKDILNVKNKQKHFK